MKDRGVGDVRTLQKLIISTLKKLNARDIQIFDVAHMTFMFDRVIIATADTGRQIQILANQVESRIRDAGWPTPRVEGMEGTNWWLVDLGDIVVHLQSPAARERYRLETLWDQPAPDNARKPRAPRATAVDTASTRASRMPGPRSRRAASATAPAAMTRAAGKKRASA